MERLNFVRDDGVIRLPPGFRFQPTDEEIVFQYLKRKVFSLPLPASIIPEINISHYDPWDLPGEQEKYFFYNKEAIKQRKGSRSSRTAGSGYWKATGVDKKIESSARNERMGMKKTLVFYRGTASDGSRTDWVMHEYRLVGAETAPTCIFPHTNFSNQQNSSTTRKEDWVLCRIFLRKRSTTDECAMIRSQKDNTVENVRLSRPISCMLPSSSSSSSSSNSSVITDASSSGSNHEENSDCDSSFSPYFYYRKEA